jgi:hypothetical protein
MPSKFVRTVGRVNPVKTAVDVAAAQERTAEALHFEHLRVINSIVTSGLPAHRRAELLADAAVFANTRLEQVAGEIEAPSHLSVVSVDQNVADKLAEIDQAAMERAHGVVDAKPVEDDLDFLK